MKKPLMIGDLANATGTKVNTIRFYEEIGLLPLPARTSSGRRIYEQSDLQCLRFVRRGRKLGFDIDDIRSLLRLADHPQQNCEEAAHIARHQRAAVDQKIAQLKQLRHELDKLVQSCAGGTVAHCGIMETLSADQEFG